MVVFLEATPDFLNKPKALPALQAWHRCDTGALVCSKSRGHPGHRGPPLPGSPGLRAVHASPVLPPRMLPGRKGLQTPHLHPQLLVWALSSVLR